MQGADQPAPNSPESIKSKLNARAAPPMRGLSVRVYRHYGAIDIEFGVTAQFDPENEADQMRLWQMLYQQVNDMHDDWAQNELPNVKPLSKVGQGRATEDEEFEAYEFYISESNGKSRCKVRSKPGTKYGKYGVIVSDDWAKKNGVLSLLDGQETFKPHNLYFKTQGGVVHEFYNKDKSDDE